MFAWCFARVLATSCPTMDAICVTWLPMVPCRPSLSRVCVLLSDAMLRKSNHPATKTHCDCGCLLHYDQLLCFAFTKRIWAGGGRLQCPAALHIIPGQQWQCGSQSGQARSCTVSQGSREIQEAVSETARVILYFILNLQTCNFHFRDTVDGQKASKRLYWLQD